MMSEIIDSIKTELTTNQKLYQLCNILVFKLSKYENVDKYETMLQDIIEPVNSKSDK